MNAFAHRYILYAREGGLSRGNKKFFKKVLDTAKKRLYNTDIEKGNGVFGTCSEGAVISF